jgi:hypothetical protein
VSKGQGGKRRKKLERNKIKRLVNTRSYQELICIHVVISSVCLAVCEEQEKGRCQYVGGRQACVFAKQYFCEYMGHKVTDTTD